MTTTRRRGPDLERAIHRATLDALAENGYAGLTVEGVARRAGTGKAALYRRHASKEDLVLAALLALTPEPLPTTGGKGVRAALVAVLTAMADALAGQTGYPGLRVMTDLLTHPSLRDAFAERVVGPRLAAVEAVLRDSAARGETRPVDPYVARVGPALVLQSFLLTGTPPRRAEVTRIVDHVLLPLLTTQDRPGH